MAKKKRKRNYEEVGHIRIPWCKLADGRTVVDPRKYNRKRETFIDHEEALLTARRIATEINEGGAEIQAFTAADRATFAHASATAAKYKLDLTGMAADYSAIREAMNGTKHSVIEVVNAGVKALSQKIHRVPDIVAEMLQTLAPKDLHGRTKRGLESTGKLLAERFPGDIREVKAAHISLLLDGKRDEKTNELVGGLRKRGGDPIGTRRRDNILDEIRHIWNFAKLHEYIPDTIGEPQKVAHLHKRNAPISFFTVQEIRLILDNVSEEWLPYVVLNCFAGGRSEELCLGKDAPKHKDPLRWEDFDWDDREIHIREETAKGTGPDRIGHPRIMPILPNAYEWLVQFKNRTGPIAPKGERPDREFGKGARLERKINRALKAAPVLDSETALQLQLEEIAPAPLPLMTEFTWRQNALRHSYGSYRASILKNIHMLADEMGNSVDMIRRHYRNPRPISQAKAYFDIFPKTAVNVTPFDREAAAQEEAAAAAQA